VAFTFGPRGKPALRGDSPIRFNLSHSGDLALFAFTANCEIGVDLEEVQNMSDIEQIASRYFCRAEASELLSIADTELKQKAFYRCWTRKEAYVKAVGDGLYVRLDQFQVTLLSDQPARLVHIGNDVRPAAEWTLQHLDPAPKYVGALAYKAVARDVAFRQPLEAQELLERTF
jgi:4'-phosphopantetheinyl transferase